MQDFAKGLNEEFRKSKVSGLVSVHEASKGFFYAPRDREFFLLGLFSNFGLKYGRLFQFEFGALRLDEDVGFSRKKESSPRQRRCSLRRRGPPRRGIVHLGEP